MATLRSVLSEIKSQSDSLQNQLAMYEGGLRTMDVPETQRHAAESISRKFSTIQDGPECHSALMEAITQYHGPFGDSAQVLIDEANSMLHSSPPSSKRGRHTVSGKQFEVEQYIDSLNYFTQGDWEFFADRSKLMPMKVARAAARLRMWGVKHLAQRSRKVPIGLLVVCHYGNVIPSQAVGFQLPPGVTHKEV